MRRRVKRFFFIFKILLMYFRYKVKQSYRKYRESHIVETIYGPVRGAKRVSCWKEIFYSYEKIPFAKPPINELRFKDPVPPDSWDTPLDCTREANRPQQVNLIVQNIEGEEDCLYLNVYTNNPSPAAPRPVMVWIYGGGFVNGTTSRDIYSPDYFMSQNVVLVSIAYRVSILGFLSLKDPNLEIPGNAGLRDQIMALKWVRDNISNFGGDPNNVTVFGESAGGTSVNYLMITEQAKGLFHKAIIMSGSIFCPWALLPPNEWPYRLASKMGFQGPWDDKSVLKFFMKANPKDLVKHESKLRTKEEMRNRILFTAGPTIEPYVTKNSVIPMHPRLMARNAWSKDIPLIIVGNSFEGLFALSDVKRNPQILEEIGDCTYLVPLELNLDRQSADCLQLGLKLKHEFFPKDKPSQHAYLNLLSYKLFWHGIHRTVLSRLRHANAPTYLYRFDFDSPTFNHVRILCCGKNTKGVAHADDLSYLFYNAMAEDLNPTSAEYKTIRSLTGMWAHFALTGNPNTERITSNTWMPVQSDIRPFKCLNISYDLSYMNLSESKSMEVWDSLYEKDELI